jgi:hypothetical protein
MPKASLLWPVTAHATPFKVAIKEFARSASFLCVALLSAADSDLRANRNH